MPYRTMRQHQHFIIIYLFGLFFVALFLLLFVCFVFVFLFLFLFCFIGGGSSKGERHFQGGGKILIWSSFWPLFIAFFFMYHLCLGETGKDASGGKFLCPLCLQHCGRGSMVYYSKRSKCPLKRRNILKFKASYTCEATKGIMFCINGA